MDIRRRAARKFAEQLRRPPVAQQVKIIEEEHALPLPRQRPARQLQKQAPARRVLRAGESGQLREARPFQRAAKPVPEQRYAVGIGVCAHTDRRRVSLPRPQIPFHRRRLPISHRRHQHRQRRVSRGAQTLLYAL